MLADVVHVKRAAEAWEELDPALLGDAAVVVSQQVEGVPEAGAPVRIEALDHGLELVLVGVVDGCQQHVAQQEQGDNQEHEEEEEGQLLSGVGWQPHAWVVGRREQHPQVGDGALPPVELLLALGGAAEDDEAGPGEEENAQQQGQQRVREARNRAQETAGSLAQRLREEEEGHRPEQPREREGREDGQADAVDHGEGVVNDGDHHKEAAQNASPRDDVSLAERVPFQDDVEEQVGPER
mmetsp:Transcript_93240/g.240977  ORF Transcript_93240/g.240977 Transcript_93240/m.240977 type:complete len:239 (+) Transcript_93240:1435-2151(+)